MSLKILLTAISKLSVEKLQWLNWKKIDKNENLLFPDKVLEGKQLNKEANKEAV